MSVQVSTRVDEATKRQFDKICETIGGSPSDVLRMLIKGVVNHRGIPFPVVAPSEKTKKMTMQEAFGCMRGQFTVPDDFDAPLEDFREYMQ